MASASFHKLTPKKFAWEKNVVITFKDTIRASEVGSYLKENIENFHENTQFMVLCGVHHSIEQSAEGNPVASLGFAETDFVQDYSSMFEDVKNNKSKIWKARKYLCSVEAILSKKQYKIDAYKVKSG